MERCKNDARREIGIRLLVLLVLLIGGLTTATAQKALKGFWFETNFAVGTGLKTSAYQGLKPTDEHFANSMNLTLGYHLPKTRLSLGGGVGFVGYDNPKGYRHTDLNLILKYRPIASLQGLTLSSGVGLFLVKPKRRMIDQAADYQPKFYTQVALGWEFRRLLGGVGLGISAGLSWDKFSYEYDTKPEVQISPKAQARGSQTAAFVRLSLLLN